MIDTIKGVITYGTAAVVTIGGMVIAVIAWAQPMTTDSRDLAVLFAFLGLIVGGAVQFLFNQESALRATRAAESKPQ